MRRKDREITDLEEITEIIQRCDICRIALHDREYPYILPVNFGFERSGTDLLIYIHGAKEGTKHTLIQQNNKVSFEMDCSHRLIPPAGDECCSASMAYESVIGQGEITLLSGEEKLHGLSVIADHYQIESRQFHPGLMADTAVYCIRSSACTAKRRL